jgi:hypothetical protein
MWEVELLAAFEALGSEGRIDEHGFRGALVSGEWRGSEFLVISRAEGQPGFGNKPQGRIELAGIDVTIAEDPILGVSYQFTCPQTSYQIVVKGPNGRIAAFTERFLSVLECSA